MNLTRLRLASAAAVLSSAAACGLPYLPSTPSDPPALEIRGATLLMVGGRGRLSAWQPGGREVRASWSSDGDAIAITRDGAVTGRRLGHAIVQASSGDSTGSTTVHVVTSVEGRWHGSITVVDCLQTLPPDGHACEGRRGLTAPLVVDITQRASADRLDNLRATVDVFAPAARGSFIGALDSSGHLFLEGYVERAVDSFGGAVRFRWQLEGDRLVPFTIDGEIINVQLSQRIGTATAAFNEIWQVSTMVR
jgi:hypothetical protein